VGSLGMTNASAFLEAFIMAVCKHAERCLSVLILDFCVLFIL